MADKLTIELQPSGPSFSPGQEVTIKITRPPQKKTGQFRYTIEIEDGLLNFQDATLTESDKKAQLDKDDHAITGTWTLPNAAGEYWATAIAQNFSSDKKLEGEPWYGTVDVTVVSKPALPPVPKDQGVSVTLRRTVSPLTDDVALWVVIRATTERIAFANYSKFMDLVLCQGMGNDTFGRLKNTRFLPYNDTEAYRLLKVATEAFLMANCGVPLRAGDEFADITSLLNSILDNDIRENLRQELENKFQNANLGEFNLDALEGLWDVYLETVEGRSEISSFLNAARADETITNEIYDVPSLKLGPQNITNTLPYLAQIRNKLPELGIADEVFADADLPRGCHNIIRRKLNRPCLLELIWSYWHEEGMLVQSMNAISLRFQNVRSPGNGNPLAMMEIDPLRPLNNIIWGYIQDEQHRLTVLRRIYEYDHHYGLPLVGKAVPEFRPADSRSKFLEAFHNLLYVTAIFFKEDDDTTVIADAFPVLHALKEVHFLLAEGAHNQFGDLPSTARQEMLMQQWILARPEFREFLPTRISVAYPEPWMNRVDAMKAVQGWTDTSVLHFRNLGMFGERALLSIRYSNWGSIEDPVHAHNWARFWRAELQGYIHAYRAVTGVDLTAEITDSQQEGARYAPPSVHLLRRMEAQRRNLPAAGGRMISTGSGAQPTRRSTQLAVPKRSR
jgi:hypothetical protein